MTPFKDLKSADTPNVLEPLMEHTFQLFLTEIEDGGWGGDFCTYHISLQMLSTH